VAPQKVALLKRVLHKNGWRFIVAEWQTLIPSVSCGCEMVFEEEVFLLYLSGN
jgi:hypothetical protein